MGWGGISGWTTYAGSDASIPLGADTIQFEAGITESDLTFFINGADLQIGIKDSPSDVIIIKDHFNAVANRIENLKFTSLTGEETTLDLTTKNWLTTNLTTTGTSDADKITAGGSQYGNSMINSGNGDDLINASLGDDVIYSEGGNDTINAGLGNDLLNGGIGNDTLNGGEGSDIYEFNLGDGEDTITDSANGDDENKIIFGIGISASNLVFTRGSGTGSNNDLIVTFNNSPDDKFTIKNFVYSVGI